MQIVHSTEPRRFQLRGDFLAPYYGKGDPFETLLARSTYVTKYARPFEEWTDTIRRVVEGNIALSPVTVSEREAELLFHLFWTGQALPPGRGLWTGGVPGIPADARFNCFSRETRFWANGQLTSFEEAVGQTVEVLCADGTWRPAEVRSFGVQALQTITMKPPGRTNFSFEFTATPGHRWLTSNRGKVTDLKVGDRVLVTPRDISSLRNQQEYKDGFAHGFVFGDGCKETQKETTYRLRLCGEKDWQHKDLLKQSSYFHMESSYVFDNGDPLLYFKNETNIRRNLPHTSSSLAYQAGFLEGWLAADGSWRTNGRGVNRLCSTNAIAIEWAAERLPLLGYCPTGQYEDPNMETNFGKRSAPIQVLTVQPMSIEYTVRSIADTGREEEVFCVVEPETHTFTLEGGVPTGNCWYTTLYGPEDWCWMMNQLMLGGGVGIGLGEISQLEPVVEGPARFAVNCVDYHSDFSEVKPNDKSFLNGQTPVYHAEDSRAGWVESLRRVLTAAWANRDLIVDVSDIRPRGMPIRTFGGIACGPGPLTHLLRSAWAIVRGAAGRKLTSVECLDITNMIGFCVKSGNVRRSALIALGDAEDQPFRDAKKDFEKVLSHRHTSNNSIVFRSWEQIRNFDWKGLVDDNITFGEPGIFNLAKVWETDPGAKGVNPCLAGDTKIAVADGRNAVTIRELAETGEDVPVYSVDRVSGKVAIKMGRHPRVTGYQKQLVRVWLDDGSYLDTTPGHKFLLRDGSTVEAAKLSVGASLPRFTKRREPVKKGSKDYYLMHCNTRDSLGSREYEHRLIARFYEPAEWDRVYGACKQGGFTKTGGLVVHHKDYNPLNNRPENLQILTFRDHAALHAQHDTAGEKNGHWSGVSPEELKAHGLNLTRVLGRRFSGDEWSTYAKKHSLPQQFSEFRCRMAGSVVGFAKLCASELDLDHVGEDPRVVRTYESMLKQGYDARIHAGTVLVHKTCEECKQSFEVLHAYRERSFCSEFCGNAYLNSNTAIREKRVAGLHGLYKNRMVGVQTEQARICSGLRFGLGRDPNRKEWSDACRQEGVPSRIGPTLKFGYNTFKQVLEAAADYNHKVVRVEELPGLHTVYNITVDDFHTVGVTTSNTDGHWSGVYVGNCGEQALFDREACNLGENFPANYEAGTDPDMALQLQVRYCMRQRLTPLSDPQSHAVGLQNMRVGVALGGLCDFDWTPEMLSGWYRTCREEANSYADELRVNRPITVTTVKPSGTISLLNGSSPGIHAPFAPFYIRRARIAKNDPMAPALMEAGVPSEFDQYDQTGNTLVFSFPMRARHTRMTVQTETIHDQFERQAVVQKYWADNAVSATLSFDPATERELTAKLLEEYVPQFKSTSMLAKSGHGYVQAPYEAVDESTYRALASQIRHDHPLARGGDLEVDECASGSCPVR